MDMEKIQRRENKFSEVLTMRITEMDSNFLKTNNISPQGLLREAIKDLRKNKDMNSKW